MSLTYGSLFSGIGGFDLGLDQAGMACAWQVEKDKSARSVLKKHWPDVPKYEDVRNVGKGGVPSSRGENIVTGFDQSRGQYTGDIAAPLRVNGAVKPGVNPGKPDNMCVSGNFGVRRLTPLECERLQGFPDNWTAGQSDSARYRQLGNAVAVPVARWIGGRLNDHR